MQIYYKLFNSRINKNKNNYIYFLYNIRPTGDQAWVSLERIQFVGACNPPTDPGRKPLSHRFLRHVPVIYVDYPGETSLKQVNYCNL